MPHTVGRGPVPRRAIDRGNGVGLREFFAQVERSRGTGPRATVCKASALYRRARACPSPCLGRSKKRLWLAFGFRAGRAIAGDRPPPYGWGGCLRFTVGRGPVPRHAIGHASVHNVCRSRAPALDPFGSGCSRTTVTEARERSRGTGPRATVKKRAADRRARACPSPCLDRHEKRPWLACGFRVGRTITGDRPPRYGLGKGFSSPCAVREQVLPNYSFQLL